MDTNTSNPNKNTLKIGDILTIQGLHGKYHVIGFKGGAVQLLNGDNETYVYDVMINATYTVNGVTYSGEDIIVPAVYTQDELPITKDNIKDVLAYNGFKISAFEDWLAICDNDKLGTVIVGVRIDRVDNWLEILELGVGKLKPLLKPLTLMQWFKSLNTQHTLTEERDGPYYIKYWVSLPDGNRIGFKANDMSRQEQEEYLLKIIDVYKDYK